jgi:hypothetical protein
VLLGGRGEGPPRGGGAGPAGPAEAPGGDFQVSDDDVPF